jgi:hypothetical protein
MSIKSTLVATIAIGLLAGSAVSVSAQDEEADSMAPSAFSGNWDNVGDAAIIPDPDTGLERWEWAVVAADPRASGTWTQVEDFARVEVDGLDYEALGSSLRLANDGGAWVGMTRTVMSVDPNGEGTVGAFMELTGEGGYEGLSLFVFDTAGVAGEEPVSNAFIVPTEMVPVMPPAPAAE